MALCEPSEWNEKRNGTTKQNLKLIAEAIPRVLRVCMSDMAAHPLSMHGYPGVDVRAVLVVGLDLDAEAGFAGAKAAVAAALRPEMADALEDINCECMGNAVMLSKSVALPLLPQVHVHGERQLAQARQTQRFLRDRGLLAHFLNL